MKFIGLKIYLSSLDVDCHTFSVIFSVRLYVLNLQCFVFVLLLNVSLQIILAKITLAVSVGVSKVSMLNGGGYWVGGYRGVQSLIALEMVL